MLLKAFYTCPYEEPSFSTSGVQISLFLMSLHVQSDKILCKSSDNILICNSQKYAILEYLATRLPASIVSVFGVTS